MSAKKRIIGAVLTVGLVAAGVTVFQVRAALGPALDVPAICSVKPQAGWLIQNVSVFDSRSGRVYEHLDVYFDAQVGPEIISVGPTGSLPPNGATVVDGRGRTVLPGFVNAHVHALLPVGAPWSPVFPSAAYNLDAWLAAGITTVFDLGGPSANLGALAVQLESGALLGPHLLHGDTLITVPDSHPLPAGRAVLPWPLGMLAANSMYVVDDKASARDAVARIAATGAPWTKSIVDELPTGSPSMSRAILGEVLTRTREAGMRSVVHVGDEEDAKLAVEADLQAHMVYRGALRESTIHAIAALDTRVVPTVYAFQSSENLAAGTWSSSEWDRALHPRSLLAPLEGEAGAAIRDVPVIGAFAQELQNHSMHWDRTLQSMNELGVTLLVGTDAPLPGVLPGSAYHNEIDRMASAYIPMATILQGATFEAAKFVEEPITFGAVESGLRADLLLVRGNPIVEPQAVHRIEAVFLSGRRIERDPSRLP
ncbi:MAG: amidohydrolase family protein [Rhodobacterales bacterium]|nr:amidohydrolase family protein [Rhodobacterales bacterium]